MQHLIVIATKDEIKLVEELKLDNHPILITGVGGSNVIKSLKNIPRNTSIINVGYAGGHRLQRGSKYYVSESSLLHENVDYKEETFRLNKFGIPCYTSTDFVTNTKKNGPCLFDMELAYICSMFKNVTSIKFVSDNLSIEEYEEKIENDRKSKSKTSR